MKERRIVSLVIVCIIAIFGVLFSPDRNANDHTIKSTHSIIMQAENYNVNIRFPQTNNAELNNKILGMIHAELESFKDVVSERLIEDFTHELNIGYSLFYSNDLATIQFDIHRTLSNEISEDLLLYYYDTNKNIEVLWENLFINEENALDRLTNIVQVRLVEEGVFVRLSPTRDTFNYLIFDKDSFTILLPGLSVLTFDYSLLNEFLVFRGSDGAISNDEAAWVLPVIERRTRDVEQLKNKKVILFTYDDGPAGDVTNRLLDELGKRDARVTFFVLGSRINRFPEIVRRAHAEGHTIANHGFSHRSFLNMSHDDIVNEINMTNQLISNITRTETRHLRPPYGEYNEAIFEISNMSFILWNIDPRDWQHRNANTVYNNIMNHAKDGGIIVLHDLYESTIDGTIRAIDSLLAQGFAIISLEEAEALGLIDPYKFVLYHSLR